MVPITVLMTTYNSAKYAKEAIGTMLNQTFKDFEFIIVDDGSDDNISELISFYKDDRIRYIPLKKNGGVATARNIGLDNAKGKYIAIADSDDVYLPERLECEYMFLERNPMVSAVYSEYSYIDKAGGDLEMKSPVAYFNPEYVRANMFFGNVIGNSGSMIKKEMIDKHYIKYDETYTIASDYKFWIDFMKYGDVVGVDKVLWKYRVNNESLYTGTSLNTKKEYERKIKKYIFDNYSLNLFDGEINFIVDFLCFGDKIENVEQLSDLYTILTKLLLQVKAKEHDFADEFRIVCRKKFESKILDSKLFR